MTSAVHPNGSDSGSEPTPYSLLPTPGESTSAPSESASPGPFGARPGGVHKPYLVGVLYYGGIDREHDKCIQTLRSHPYIASVFEMHGCPYIDIGRSIIATNVLDHPEYGGLLFFDHDMIFDPEEVTKLLESTEACQGVVGAAYSMRRPGHMIGGIDTTKLSAGEKVVFFDGGKPHPASYLGMGMTAIHRSVFERLVKRADEKHEKHQTFLRQAEDFRDVAKPFAAANGYTPEKIDEVLDEIKDSIKPHGLPRMKSGISDADVIPFFSMLQQNGVYYGEDISFCLRCHDAKIPVQLDTRVRVYHKGSYCYGLEDCGMVVPYCTRLESVASTCNAVQNTPYHVPELQKLVDADPSLLPNKTPPGVAVVIEDFPESHDPFSEVQGPGSRVQGPSAASEGAP